MPNENLKNQIDRVLSSVGSEHLVYTQRVGGSNPSGPTKKKNPTEMWDFFVLISFELKYYICQAMLSQQQINIIINTLKPFNPKKIGIFGSYSRGENTNDSDIDILYLFDSKYSLFDLAGLQIELEEKLKKDVDLVEYTAIHPLLKEKILKDLKMVYEQ